MPLPHLLEHANLLLEHRENVMNVKEDSRRPQHLRSVAIAACQGSAPRPNGDKIVSDLHEKPIQRNLLELLMFKLFFSLFPSLCKEEEGRGN